MIRMSFREKQMFPLKTYPLVQNRFNKYHRKMDLQGKALNLISKGRN